MSMTDSKTKRLGGKNIEIKNEQKLKMKETMK